MLWHFTVERFWLTEKNLECWSAVEWVVLTSWWCVGWTAHIVDAVVFTRFIEDTRTPTTSPALTRHRRPTSTPGHVTLTLLLHVTTRDLFTRSRRHHTMTSTTHARSVDCILLLGCVCRTLCICLLVTTISCAKKAEPIEMQFGTQVGPRNHVLGGGLDPPKRKWQF